MPKVPKWVTKSVAFVGSAPHGSVMTLSGGSDLRLRGTAFYVSAPLPGTGRHLAYAVTAKHVINGIAARGEQGFLRRPLMLQPQLEHRFSPAVWQAYKYEEWIQHPDPTVDAAIMLLSSVHMFDMSWIDPASAVTPAIIARENIGVGDEVFITGLFVNHPGSLENVPIVRVGNIAAMNGSEKVNTPLGETDALLVEARSVGGLSGSPVFVHLGIARILKPGEPGTWATEPTGVYYWLGLVQGHFAADGLTVADQALEDSVSAQRDRVNMGIAIVVPALRILEIFDEPQVKHLHAQAAQAPVVRRGATQEPSGLPEQVEASREPLDNETHGLK